MVWEQIQKVLWDKAPLAAFTSILLAFSLNAPSVSALSVDPHFRKAALRDEQFLIQVTAIGQDTDGFVWLGSTQGLYRYDGYELTEYSAANSSGLTHNHIRAIHVDHKGVLWVGTSDGLLQLDTGTDLFVKTKIENAGSAKLYIYDIHEDMSGRLWIASSQGLYFANLSREFSQATLQYEGNPGSVRAIVHDEDNDIWIGTEQAGVFKLSGGTIFRKLEAIGAQESSVTEAYVREIVADQHGDIWVATYGNGLFRINADSLSVNEILATDSLASNTVRALLIDSDGDLWVGSDGGLQKWNFRKGVLDPPIAYESTVHVSPVENMVYELYQDDADLLWVGSYSGVSVADPYSQGFGYSDLSGLKADDLVSDFVEKNQSEVLITTYSGLALWNHEKDTLIDLDLEFDGEPRFTTAVIGYDGEIWVGSFDDGLYQIRPNGQIIQHENEPGNQLSISHNGITDLLITDDRYLWVSTFGGGVNRIDLNTGLLKRYPDPLNPEGSFPDLRCRQLVAPAENQLWVATEDEGIVMLNRTTGETKIISKRDNPSLPTDSIAHFDKVEDGVWVGTVSSGVFKVDLSGRLLASYGYDDGLKRGEVHGLVVDGDGHVWVAHSDSLSRIDPSSRAVKRYQPGLGLMTDFYQGADLFLNGRYVVFGGTFGFNFFDPLTLRENTKKPVLRIVRFELFGEERDLQNWLTAGEMLLPPSLNTLAFKFSSLDYTYPQRNQYKYKLEGFDKDWINNGTDRDVTYTNLDPGTYTLRVQGSNSDGVWNTEGLTIPITIMPPLWATWWAYSLYFIVAVFCFYQILQYLNSRQQREANQRFHLRILGYVESLNQATQCILNADHNGRVIFLNSAARKVFGRSTSEFAGHGMYEVLFQDERERLRAREAMQTRDHFYSEVDFKSGDGNLRKLEIDINTVPSSPKDNLRYVCTAKDITEKAQLVETLVADSEQKQKEIESLHSRLEALTSDKDEQLSILRASMRESTALAKEIHDRIGDSLQTIASLLSIQADRIEDSTTSRILLDNQERLLAIAYIHEQQQASDDPRLLRVSSYVDVLVSHLVRRYRPQGVHLHLHKNVDELQVELDQAVPLGLILNELVTNALVHGYPSQVGSANISITLARSNSDCLLVVADDGVGMPANIRLPNNASGLEIVSVLSEQLSGVLTRIGVHGTTFELRFPLSDFHN